MPVTFDKRFLLVGVDGSHRFPVKFKSKSGHDVYRVGTGVSGAYEDLEDFDEVLRRVLLHGKIIRARAEANRSDSSGVRVPGKSILAYWLSPELRPVVLGAALPSLDTVPALASVVGPASQAIPWSDQQLSAAVFAYLGMLEDQQAGRAFDRAAICGTLATELGRSTYSIDLRMQNISAVLAYMGRASLDGVRMADHVGSGVAARLEALIGAHRSQMPLPIAAFESAVTDLMREGIATRPSGVAKPTTTTATVTVYQRSAAVKAWVLLRAKGRCEACPNEAPFKSRSGVPYLEVHHVRPLAEGGSDTTGNAVALCPNCHRWLHHGSDAKQVRTKLFANVEELLPE